MAGRGRDVRRMPGTSDRCQRNLSRIEDRSVQPGFAQLESRLYPSDAAPGGRHRRSRGRPPPVAEELQIDPGAGHAHRYQLPRRVGALVDHAIPDRGLLVVGRHVGRQLPQILLEGSRRRYLRVPATRILRQVDREAGCHLPGRTRPARAPEHGMHRHASRTERVAKPMNRSSFMKALDSIASVRTTTKISHA